MQAMYVFLNEQQFYTYRKAEDFGGLLKMCYLAKFTLAVEPVLYSHNDIHNKMANQMHWGFDRAVS